MTKRLSMILAGGALVAGMVPAVAAADNTNLGQCVKDGRVGTNAEGGFAHVGRNGDTYWALPWAAKDGMVQAKYHSGLKGGYDYDVLILDC